MAIKSRAELRALFENGDFPDQDAFWDWLDSFWSKGETVPADNVTIGEAELVSGAVVDWDFDAVGSNAYLEIAHNATLNITNMQPGQFGMLVVQQDGVGGRTLALPAGALVGYDGVGIVTLSGTAGAIDALSVYRSAAGYLWLINKTFTGA